MARDSESSPETPAEASNASEESGDPSEAPKTTDPTLAGKVLPWLFALPVLAGLMASAVLFVDYMRPLPAYCEEGGGCDAVKHTIDAWPFGLPMPLFGILGFLLLGILMVVRGRLARRLLVMVASVAGLWAAHLIAVQIEMHVFCKYCMVADLSALTIMLAATLRLLRHWDPPGRLGVRMLAIGVLGIAVALPIWYGMNKKVDVPEAIRKEMAGTEAGKVTVVDFVDYECPFCRRTNVALEPILKANESRIRVVRRNVPLDMHPHARDAARAACCGQKLGKGEEMTQALLSTDVENLTPEGCAKLASDVGLQSAAYLACVQDPSTEASIQADIDEFHAAKGQALPTIWVDDQPLFGEQTTETLDEAVKSALAAKSSS